MHFGASVLPQNFVCLVGWLVAVGLHFGLKWRRIWVREEVRWAHDIVSYIFLTKEVYKLTKIAEQEHFNKCSGHWKRQLLRPALQSHTTAH